MFVCFLIITLLLSSLVNALTITENDDFQKVLNNQLSEFENIHVVQGRININLNLKIDGSLEYSFHDSMSLRNFSSNTSALELFPLSTADSFQGIKIYELINSNKIEFNQITILDTSNCDKEFIFNPNLKQILVCISPIKDPELAIELNTVILPDKLSSNCPKPTDEVSKNMSFVFYTAKKFSYPITIQITADPELEIQKPPIITLENNETPKSNFHEIQNGFILDVPPQPTYKNYLIFDTTIVGSIKSFETNKSNAIAKYINLLITSSIFSVFLPVISYVFKKYQEKTSKYKQLDFPIQFIILIIFSLVIWNNFISFYQDIKAGYVEWWFALLPSLFGIASIFITFFFIYRIKRPKLIFGNLLKKI